MEKMIACCGVDCAVCDAYVATRTNDDALRRTTAERWARHVNIVPVEPEDLISRTQLQPQTDGPHIANYDFCNICTCCLEKQHTTCAECDEYVCDRLQTGFEVLSKVLEIEQMSELEAHKTLLLWGTGKGYISFTLMFT